MITLENIGFEYSGRWLFRDTTLQIKPGDRIGLVGRNGTGKTTLLRMLQDEITPAEGRLSMMKGIRIGCLEQEMQSLNTGQTVFEVAETAFSDQLQLKDEIEELLANPAINSDPALITQLSEKQVRLEALDGYNLGVRISGILAGLGFSEHDQNQPFDTFSGGWRMRVMLARLLLTDPDLLLLDEPTNHLDLPSIEWLENYLRDFRGAYIIVSHDRDFVDRLVTSIVELSQQRFNIYKGNYSFFLKEKVIRAEQQLREFENQQKFISETERFINRFRAKASKAKQVQSKVKMLDRLERFPEPENEAATVNFRFGQDVVPGKNILGMEVERKAYGEKIVLGPSKQHIMRGDKIALIGANGIGKSTILRMIAGSEPFEGDRKLGHNVTPSFFAQHQLDALDPSSDILEEMRKYVYAHGEPYVRGILGGFLFTGEDVFKKIQVLSGGEKSRVALAKTLLSASNFLLLDEPTNHLDIQSIQILSKALSQYDGTYVIVSHDRYFLREVANKIWHIEDGQIREYAGNFDDFVYHQALKAGKVVEEKKKTAAAAPQKKEKSDYHAEKARKKKARKLQSDLKKTEDRIMELEGEKENLLADMAKPEMATQFDKLSGLQQAMNKLEKELSPLQDKWEELLETIENEGLDQN